MAEKPPYPTREQMIQSVQEWIIEEKGNLDKRYIMITQAELRCPQCGSRSPGLQFQNGWRCLWLHCEFEFPEDFIVASPKELQEELKKRKRKQDLAFFNSLVGETLIKLEISAARCR